MRLRYGMLALLAALAALAVAGPGTSPAQPRGVVEPHLPALGKEPAVHDLRHFLHSLRSREHASRHAFRRLQARKQRFSSAARDVPAIRDGKRKRFLRPFTAKPGRRHRGRSRSGASLTTRSC